MRRSNLLHRNRPQKIINTKPGNSINAENQMTITIGLSGGIGNRLFQIALLLTIVKKYPNIKCDYYYRLNQTHGVNMEWCDNILKENNITHNKKYRVSIQHKIINEATPWTYNDNYLKIINDNQYNPINCTLTTYFQSYKYFHTEDMYIKTYFNNFLFNGVKHDKFEKYDLDNSACIHIRGGDYAKINLENNLKRYYSRCIDTLKKKCNVFLAITNDTKYAKSLLASISVDNFKYEIVDLDTWSSLYLMTICKLGIICANSTFSWWGSYLNTHNPDIYMPKIWFRHNVYYPDIYFSNVNIVDL
mgnify:CR=1 FL=1